MSRHTHFEHHIDIAVPVEKLWSLVVDIGRWPTITPTISAVEVLDGGSPAVGTRARLKQPYQRPAVWTITALEAPTRFEWRREMLGLTMSAAHRLRAIDDQHCHQHLTVDIAGRGAGLLGRLSGRAMRRALATENEAFKKRAEARPVAGDE